MTQLPVSQKEIYKGVLLAVLATLVWSGNFIVARSESGTIPPISLAFFRWLTASIFMVPVALFYGRKKYAHFPKFSLSKITAKEWRYLGLTALTGITLFNTLVYVAGKYSPAINLALIGTTSSPVMAIILAAIFLKEGIGTLRIIGLLLCIGGIVLLLSGGDWNTLLHLKFSPGDWWILAAALMFAIYNILVRQKKSRLNPVHFLLFVFVLGTAILFPAFLWEQANSAPVIWNMRLVLIILYLGLGTSVISFMCWNAAIARLGAGRTALFGNLIPIFSSVEAVWLLNEKLTWLHLISGLLVIGGLLLANIKAIKPKL